MPPTRAHRSLPVVLALSLYALVGGIAAGSFASSPGKAVPGTTTTEKTAPPLALEDAHGVCPADGRPRAAKVTPVAYATQSPAEAPAAALPPVKPHPEAKNSEGCVHCHANVEPSHESNPSAMSTVGCVGCHGGEGKELKDKDKAHKYRPRFPELWGKGKGKRFSGNPERAYTLLNREDPNFIRFVNPGDLRVADLTCGTANCHGEKKGNVVLKVRKSLMTQGGFLFGAALYNNGASPVKDTRYGESYSPAAIASGKGTDLPVFNPHQPHSLPQRVHGTFFDEDTKKWRGPTPDETLKRGWLSFLDPLPRWEVTQTGNVLRVFERGGFRRGEIGNPLLDEDAGRPDVKLSARGHGTLLRTDPVFLGIQKTRLLDPTLNFPGTNDQPGDFRSGGCTACHNVYANDPDPFHAGPYAKFGNRGRAFTADAAMKDAVASGEPGHPIRHGMTNSIPTSQCISCHVHPGTSMLTTFLGYTWWDNETDAEGMYPEQPFRHSAKERDAIQNRNPEGSALRGKWGDPRFLTDVLPKLNPSRKHTQFAQFNGHGWIYRAVYKRDRKGNLLDKDGKVLPEDVGSFPKNPPAPNEPLQAGQPVHLRDIHLEKGMHCVDCHFKQDNHGNLKLYGEPRPAIEVTCVDCHGTVRKRADLDPGDATTGGPAGGNPLSTYALMTVEGGPAIRWEKKDDGTIIQRSAVTPGLEWEVPQVMDSITPGNKHYNPRARYAKTIQRDNKTWGTAAPNANLAHGENNMACYTCHSSWTSSCFGCHLQMTANAKKPQLHNEGTLSRNWTSYNFQTLRDDLYMLGKEGSVPAPKDASGAASPRTVPIRSSCAVSVSSQNQNREWLYYQQQTVSAEGFSGTAFSPYVPHTVRGKETKGCSDCHVSEKGDNNAWLSNLFLLGSNAVNFIGHWSYVATGEGFEAIAVAERNEPAAVIGSTLHRQAYPEEYATHLARKRQLKLAHEHQGKSLKVQQRGEYVYSAEGSGGVRIYDIANIENKGFSERITSAPVSPLGQKLYVNTKYATAVAAPSTMALDPARTQRPENQEGKIHPLYAYLYITDKYEGLILVNVATLLDGDPTNNFLKRALTWNPDGALTGATNIEIAGTFAYVSTEQGLAIVNLDDPLKPQLVARIGAPELKAPKAVAVQFRYAFVCDSDGLKVLDISDPRKPHVVPGALVKLDQANDVYVSRTYAYVAAGAQGLAIVDVERPEAPKLEQRFTADGTLNDARCVRVGMTNNSTFAYVADGTNGLRVVQLTSPETTPGIYGYSPRCTPQLIATYRTHGPALALSEGLDRDRAVDESGNQLSVFGRRGARPLNLEERQRMLFIEDGKGAPLRVKDTPAEPPHEPSAATAARHWFWNLWLLGLPVFGVTLARRYGRR